ncbi:hypothetical protein FRC11_010908 [Ceratobasidium sp. 423]|nr:hypothetical protein FRC11_010908 [Ceratobasidium sp. 423]
MAHELSLVMGAKPNYGTSRRIEALHCMNSAIVATGFALSFRKTGASSSPTPTTVP